MKQADFLRHLVVQLESVGIPFMVSGSVASGYHGEPRATYDIDIIIESDVRQIESLCTALSDRCYVNVSAATEAVQRRSMFNVVDFQTGIKADLIVRKDRPFSATEFKRRQAALIAGVNAFVVSAEDCILSKLEWSKMGESERQYRDALKIAKVSSDGLDLAYLKKWAADLKVDELLQKLLSEAGFD
jgi:hypothetical protein